MQRLGAFDLGVTKAQLLSILLLVVNAFTWYLVAFEVLANILATLGITPYEIIVIWAIHFGGVTIAVLVGATLSNQFVSRTNLLFLWMSLGVFSSLVPLIIGTSSISITIFSLLLGVSFGFGMSSCMTLYADSTVMEKRGRFGGIIYFVIGIGSFLLWGALLPFTRLTEQFMILAIWRGFGLATFFILKPRDRLAKMRKSPTYMETLRRKPFLFYLFPWIMYCLINSLTRSIFPPDIVRMSFIIGSIIIGVFSLVGGVLSDLVGRKRVIITGFIMLGIGYAILGIFPENSISHYLFIGVGSIAGGMFGAVFLMSLWGDLAEGTIPEKYYAIGGLPYLLSNFLELLVSPYISELISPYATFSFASFFLFIAVLSLLFAPEPLPEKVVQGRLLRKYAEAAKKVKKNM